MENFNAALFYCRADVSKFLCYMRRDCSRKVLLIWPYFFLFLVFIFSILPLLVSFDLNNLLSSFVNTKVAKSGHLGSMYARFCPYIACSCL